MAKQFDSKLEKFLADEQLKCIKEQLSQDYVPLLKDISKYTPNERTDSYMLSLLKGELLKSKKYYDNDINQLRAFVKDYLEHIITEHYQSFLQNTERWRLDKTNNDTPRIDQRDIEIYLKPDFSSSYTYPKHR